MVGCVSFALPDPVHRLSTMLSEGQSRNEANGVTSIQGELEALRRQVESLGVALTSSRLVGTALGLMMAGHRVSRANAFEMLKTLSRDSNVRVAVLALRLVDEADRAVGC